MGGKWSKSSIVGWNRIRERIRQTPPEPAAREGAASQDSDGQGASTSNDTASNNPEGAGIGTQEEEEVAFPVRPQVPLRPMTFKAAFDFSHFLKEKGGLEGLIYSKKRQEIFDFWVFNTQGFFPVWHFYISGPFFFFSLTFGWFFNLVPMDPAEVEEANQGENNSLLHPICQHGMEDEDREVLVWKFDSRLALTHTAKVLHPEFYKDC
uniref:Protein Nef n=1 Tax=Human immunodeficiency virus type 1 TaxID=11676 RepID=A0A0C5KA04_HV1|nr:nef protein [Human immunodeficiency virus 1]